MSVHIIGAGLAGAEAALVLAERGHSVRLYEMKPAQRTPAQVSDDYAELVCSNSFRSSSLSNAVGVIKEEMRRIGGHLIRYADAARVPAGDALAVDREQFSGAVTAALRAHPKIEIVSEEVTEILDVETLVIATGPLTSAALAQAICDVTAQDRLYFYDAIAPIVSFDSIDESEVFWASRYGKGNATDYLNCPLSEAQYKTFIEDVLNADNVAPHVFEEAKYFEGCLPIEVLAHRGVDTLRFGCMKPVGLPDPRTGKEPYAVVQLRTENIDKTAFNLVGFQTRMKWGAQKEIFRKIPGLRDAEFLRLGQVHRNTYIDSPSLLDDELRLKTDPRICFAGQITGVEGYVESTACGLLVGMMIAARLEGARFPIPPPTTALGALWSHVLGKRRPDGGKRRGHEPSNIHFGLFPKLEGVRARKRERKRLYGERALAALDEWSKELSGPGEPL